MSQDSRILLICGVASLLFSIIALGTPYFWPALLAGLIAIVLGVGDE